MIGPNHCHLVAKLQVDRVFFETSFCTACAIVGSPAADDI